MDHSEVKHLPKVDHTPADLDEPARLLLRAAALLEERGWCQNIQEDGQGRMCALGAINNAEGAGATNRGLPFTKAGREANARLCKAVGTDFFGPAMWNNHPQRTQAEVVSKLRAVALGL